MPSQANALLARLVSLATLLPLGVTLDRIYRNGSHDPQARTGGTGNSPSNRHQFGNRLKAELSRPAFGCRKVQGAITFETKTLREAEGRLNTAWVCQALASLPIALCSLLEHEHRLDGEAKGGHGHNVHLRRRCQAGIAVAFPKWKAGGRYGQAKLTAADDTRATENETMNESASNCFDVDGARMRVTREN
ncbi:hypothetical protein BS47DRAFT_1488034 [Hydnum rufescens UP504]|uniref:Uncharacterized protein n=1 Tax=Hydnum rufescens UP504 TaxID=1448309 RepID=A0A9P6DS62_9AGAM|nr:hypothetical protein BS47DRAFT_1488034 [Hydnum rufescens UP504]